MKRHMPILTALCCSVLVFSGCGGGDDTDQSAAGAYAAFAGSWFGTAQNEGTLEIVMFDNSRFGGRVSYGGDNRRMTGIVSGDGRTLSLWFEDGAEWHVTIDTASMTGTGWKSPSKQFSINMTRTSDSVSSQAKTAADELEEDGSGEDASCEIVGYSTAGKKAYNGTLRNGPVRTSTFTIIAGSMIFYDNSKGSLIGPEGTSGEIDYEEDGSWSINLGGLDLGEGTVLTASYLFGEPEEDDPDDPSSDNPSQNEDGKTTTITDEVVATGRDGWTSYSGTLANSPIDSGSLSISATGVAYTDSGDGTLSGTGNRTGTITYNSGDWSIDLQNLMVAEGESITASYTY